MNKLVEKDWNKEKVQELAERGVETAVNKYSFDSDGLFHLFHQMGSVGSRVYEWREGVWELSTGMSEEDNLQRTVSTLYAPSLPTGDYEVITRKYGRVFGLSEDTFERVDVEEYVMGRVRCLARACYRFLRGEAIQALRSNGSWERDEDRTPIWIWGWRPNVVLDSRMLSDYFMGMETLYGTVFRIKLSVCFGWERFPPEGRLKE